MARKLCEFGVKAEELRTRRGMPKTELCRRVGISAVYYDYIIHGQRPADTQSANIMRVLEESAQDSA